jgi:hypothetical protein
MIAIGMEILGNHIKCPLETKSRDEELKYRCSYNDIHSCASNQRVPGPFCVHEVD